MAEEKKAKKPRAPKKAGAGTDLPAEVKEEKATAPEQSPAPVAQETAQKTAKKKATTPAKKKAVATTKKAKKAPVKEEKQAETPAEIVAEEPAKTEEKKTKKSKKKAENKPAVEEKSQEKLQEKGAETVEEKPEEKAVLPVEEPKETPEKDEKAVKKPAKKVQKTAKNTQKTGEKGAKNVPEIVSEEKKSEDKEEKKEEPAKVEDKPAKTETKPAKTDNKPTLSKAEKQKLIKQLARECLSVERKWSELVDMVSQAYQDAYPTPENANLNDVKGRVGSLLYTMQADGEIVVDGKTVSLAKKEEKTKKEPTVSALKEEKSDEEPAVAEQTVEEKAAEKLAETPAKEETTAVQRVEVQSPAPVYDSSVLFDKKKPAKKAEEKPTEKAVADVAKEKADEIKNTKAPAKAETLPAKAETTPVKTENKPAPVKKAEEKPQERAVEKQVKKEVPTRRLMRTGKVDPVKDAFLKKLRSLGGNYFEYYSIYLLERYSRMNGRRLEGLRISGGEYDGGIDGELELTDRLGFRETIYVQAKNWEPTDERWWIGETILQQFIGAVAYRQAKEGKQHCRGMFITTSAFTTGAKEMLNAMSDKFVGYDGDDLYETAKECGFGVIQDEKGNWKVDEELLSGKKSFFFML